MFKWVRHPFSLIVLISFFIFMEWTPAFSKRQDHAKTHPSPQALYAADNELYFDNMLPKNVKVVEAEAPDAEQFPNKYVVAETVHPPFSNSWTMYISPTYNLTESDVEEDVLHESCHIYMYQVRESAGREYTDEESHGPEWQDCMLTLAKKGAFAQIW